MRKYKLLVLLLVAFLVVFTAVGCRPQETPPPVETPDTDLEETPDDGMTYEDGTYTGETEFDERGWKGVVEITVEDSSITEVNYDEVNEENEKKSEQEEYNQNWKAKTDINAEEAFPGYEDALIETQDIEEVDVITGATDTHSKFVKSVENALEEDADEDTEIEEETGLDEVTDEVEEETDTN